MEKELRPWGCFLVIEDNPKYKIKRIEVDAQGSLSYQYHHFRSEAWTCISGLATVTLNGVEHVFKSGDTITIPCGVKHRIENFSNNKVVFIEVQTGTYFGEDDIVRLEDKYSRI